MTLSNLTGEEPFFETFFFPFNFINRALEIESEEAACHFRVSRILFSYFFPPVKYKMRKKFFFIYRR